MIFLNYKLNSKDYDPSRDTVSMFSRSPFELTYSNKIEAVNDSFFNDYGLNEDKMICVTECRDYTLNIYIAVNVSCFNISELDETLLFTFPDCTIARRCETTVDDFKGTLKVPVT